MELTDLIGVGEYIYFDDVKQDIIDYVEGRKDIVKAETTHFGEYDQSFKWLRSEVTGFSGIPNHGKSKWVIFLSALKMYFDGWKVAVYSPETTPPVFFFGNYIHTLTGFSVFGRKKPYRSQIEEHQKLLQDNLYLVEPEKMPTFHGILERFKRAFEYHGVDMFIIDPFNCLEREWETSKRDDRYVGDFLDHYKDFIKHTNTVGLVVSHPNAGLRTEKDGFDYQCPNMYNLAGGAMWGNKLDNLIFVHRPTFISDPQNKNVLIRHAKIKKREIVGLGGDVTVEFNWLTNRYGVVGYEPNFKDQQPDNEPPF